MPLFSATMQYKGGGQFTFSLEPDPERKGQYTPASIKAKDWADAEKKARSLYKKKMKARGDNPFAALFEGSGEDFIIMSQRFDEVEKMMKNLNDYFRTIPW
jgi:hypothetical protein